MFRWIPWPHLLKAPLRRRFCLQDSCRAVTASRQTWRWNWKVWDRDVFGCRRLHGHFFRRKNVAITTASDVVEKSGSDWRQVSASVALMLCAVGKKQINKLFGANGRMHPPQPSDQEMDSPWLAERRPSRAFQMTFCSIKLFFILRETDEHAFSFRAADFGCCCS